MGSLALASGQRVPFEGGRRALMLSIVCALAGSVFLILDLTRPADFLLILTSANPSSAISWGARILVLFIFSAIFLWVTVRNWSDAEVTSGFKGGEVVGVWAVRLSALGLAIYPAFVLRQGEAFPLWQHSLLIPLIAVSAFHAGMAATLLVSKCDACKLRARTFEIVLGVVQLILLAAILVSASGSVFAWSVALMIGTLIPLILVFVKPASTLVPRLALVLIGMFAVRYWIITAGQIH